MNLDLGCLSVLKMEKNKPIFTDGKRRAQAYPTQFRAASGSNPEPSIKKCYFSARFT